ncbi:MAG: glycosyl hydrolase 115 family protein [Bacteroidaceae bacterium]|nr:glycosyl hydrolase 115 family protein [Bacteroidaceae bacterium]
MKKRLWMMLVVALTAMGARADQMETEDGGFPIVTDKVVATIVYDKENDHSVVGVVAEALSGDIQMVTGKKPVVTTALEAGQYPIVMGTLGRSALIDQLVKEKKVDVTGIEGKWEAYTIQIVNSQLSTANSQKALVIVGSTPRGTAYGAFEVSRRIGVSPWVWWADVVPKHQDVLEWKESEQMTSKEPSVKFRGIFINDEDWGLKPWASAKMDTDIKNIGPRTYERVFELLLRLRGNILWPAMHKVSQAFWTIAENPQLARRYDIVMGSSHCEPMLRNNVGEWIWDGADYNYATNAKQVQEYWRERVEESKDMDVMYTLGMRGVHDGAIQGYKGATNIASGLKDIISFQRSLIRDIVNEDVTQVPQTFIPYKEVLDAYNAGLQVPEDVTLTWVDDNHGFIRQMPTKAEQHRKGSHGIYYHLSYYGKPQDYLWLSTIGPTQISYELTRGYEQGIQRLWMINVGDIKPAEAELEFCMDLAWDIEAWSPEKASTWTLAWAERTFGKDVAEPIAHIKQEYYRLAAGGKPEHVAFVNYTDEEMDERLRAYEAISEEVDAVKTHIRADLKDAFFELIEYPVKGAHLMNVKHLRAQQSLTEATAGHKAMALQYASEAQQAYDQIQTLTHTYNTQTAGGKWNGIMSASPRNQPAFNMPSVATAASVSPVETASSKATHITIPASDYMSASPSVKAIDGLGMQQKAVCVWPTNQTFYQKATDAPYVDYSIPVKKGTNIVTVRCLPTFPVHAGGTLRYAVQNLSNGEAPKVHNIATKATSDIWSQNVLRGWATGTPYEHEAKQDGILSLRVFLMDAGLVICEVTVEQN